MEITTIRTTVADHWRTDDDRWDRGVTWHRRTGEVTVWWRHRSELLSRKGGAYRGQRLLGRAGDRPTAERLAREALADAPELAATRC